ncbi:MAG: galactose-1-phosphate uridylyltransferase [Candidatus Thorarchaeota archaeon]|nr:galactose-1-phosphate uridylyltransferase [Candidatus Thorarchaeota archaeon]
MSTLRWNLLLGEWVIVTPGRAARPFQDPDRHCPFCPGQPETGGDWSVLTLDNKFASLTPDSGLSPLQGGVVMETPAYGYSKVIILSPDHSEQVEHMDENQLEHVFQEYLRVFEELSAKEGIRYVFEFENRGRSIGVSLDHPHAQVYALPFIPPRIQRELDQFRKVWVSEKECLLCQLLANELKSRDRVIHESEHFVSLVPYGARLPYEVHIYPREHVGTLSELRGSLQELGLMVQDVVRRYNAVFEETAYVMAMHTAPNGDHPYWHFHIEFYPPWRDSARLKYLAGIETGAWTYTNDSTPEEKARELREAI